MWNTKKNTQPQTPSISIASPMASKGNVSNDKPSKIASLFRSFMRPKTLFAVIAFLVGVVVIFYAGYELAIYQIENNDTLLPHIDFTSTSSNGSWPTSENNCNINLCNVIDKPVIYLYPTHTEKVNVKVSYNAGFSKTIPTYIQPNGWEVEAQPSGTLTDVTNGKTYPYLFWEGNPNPSLNFDMSKGFVIEGNNTKEFLQKQLKAMGLNENETKAFIAYWLPKMEHNPYNLIHFAGTEYTSLAKLAITPQPNSLLRVFMAFTPLRTSTKVSAQTFTTFHRVGFTAVEWGGTEFRN